MPHRPGLLQVQTVDVLFDELTLVHPHRLEVQSFGFITAPSAGQQGGQVVDAPGSAPAEVHVLSRGTGVVYIYMCVCVCQPLGQGFTTTTFPPSPPFPPRQGVSHAGACSICGPLHATKLRPQMGKDQGRLILYLPKPLTKLLLHFSTFCFHVLA